MKSLHSFDYLNLFLSLTHLQTHTHTISFSHARFLLSCLTGIFSLFSPSPRRESQDQIKEKEKEKEKAKEKEKEKLKSKDGDNDDDSDSDLEDMVMKINEMEKDDPAVCELPENATSTAVAAATTSAAVSAPQAERKVRVWPLCVDKIGKKCVCYIVGICIFVCSFFLIVVHHFIYWVRRKTCF